MKKTLLPTLGLVAAMAVTATLAPALPASAAPRTSTVTAGSPDLTVTVGTSAVLQGKVTPAAARSVRVQRLDGQRWVTTKTVKSDATGRYATTVFSTTVRSAKYRVAVVGSEQYTADTSGTLTYTFFGRGSAAHRSFLGGTRARWDRCDPVTYRINPKNASTAHVAEMRTAVGRVAAQSGLTFAYLGTTTAVPDGDRRNPDGTDIVVAFVKPGASPMLPRNGAAGVGGASWFHNGTEFQLTNGFVLISTESLTDLAGGFGSGPQYGWQGTRGQLFMHELGHAVGMGHAPQVDAAKPQVMYPVMTRKAAVWGAGDAKNLRELGSAGCVPGQQRVAGRAATLPRVAMH